MSTVAHSRTGGARTDTAAAAAATAAAAPTTPAVHDRFKDLSALVIEPRDRHNAKPFEKVIAAVSKDGGGALGGDESLNPTIGEMLEIEPR